LGCFGEALLRKFGAEPPQEWVGAIGSLAIGQIERGMRRLVFGWKGGPPSLPDFMRLCRTIGSDEFDEGESDKPRLPPPDDFDGDVWTMAANRYLMGHIAKRMSANPKCYGQPASFKALRAKDEDLRLLGLDKHNLDASPEFIQNVHALVAAKNAWADDMRDLAVDGGVPVETQKAVWHDWIGRAEAGMQ
jgi:hypothetical protein